MVHVPYARKASSHGTLSSPAGASVGAARSANPSLRSLLSHLLRSPKENSESASLRRRRNRTRDRGFAAPAPRCQRVPVCVFRLKLCRCAWLRPLSSGALLSNFVSLRRAIQRRLRRCRAQGAWRVCSTLCFFHHKPPSVPSNLVATTHEMDRFRGATHACFRLRSGPRTRSYKTTALPMS